MLQALVKHYDIGNHGPQKDFVGVLSSNPYTICAVLRVFGRGVEATPSKPDWENQQGFLRKKHSPLHPANCEISMQTSPVEYVRKAKVHDDGLVADTGFYIDHAVPDEAVRKISYAMNKQVEKPCILQIVHFDVLSQAPEDLRKGTEENSKRERSNEKRKMSSDDERRMGLQSRTSRAPVDLSNGCRPLAKAVA